MDHRFEESVGGRPVPICKSIIFIKEDYYEDGRIRYKKYKTKVACDCGASDHNKLVDEAIREIKRALEVRPGIQNIFWDPEKKQSIYEMPIQSKYQDKTLQTSLEEETRRYAEAMRNGSDVIFRKIIPKRFIEEDGKIVPVEKVFKENEETKRLKGITSDLPRR